MMQFNLLPHRILQRCRRFQYFLCTLLLSMLLGGALSGIGWHAIRAQQQRQQLRNDWLRQSSSALNTEIEHGLRLRLKIEALSASIAEIENWRHRRMRPVEILGMLAAHMPSETYLQKMRLQDRTITLDGVATSNRAVADFLQKLNGQTNRIASAQLLETRAEARPAGGSLSFSIALSLR
ncbi:MAG TPA: PilN domain-containing protein [Herbaspirillum sp.]|jgi:Tfp pilus assembly protein PilN